MIRVRKRLILIVAVFMLVFSAGNAFAYVYGDGLNGVVSFAQGRSLIIVPGATQVDNRHGLSYRVGDDIRIVGGQIGLDFDVDFTAPGQWIMFSFAVRNTGITQATITDISQIGITSATLPDWLILYHTDRDNGLLLNERINPGEERFFRVVAQFDPAFTTTSYALNDQYAFEFSIDYDMDGEDPPDPPPIIYPEERPPIITDPPPGETNGGNGGGGGTTPPETGPPAPPETGPPSPPETGPPSPPDNGDDEDEDGPAPPAQAPPQAPFNPPTGDGYNNTWLLISAIGFGASGLALILYTRRKGIKTIAK